jgi:glycosyltransferase involved in cell wall biosynthesis
MSCKLDLIENFNIPKEKIDVVEVGVESGAIGRFPADLLSLKEKGPLLISVASFVPEKNHKGLLRIFHRILKQYPHATLLLVGRGKLESTIHEIAAEVGVTDRIRFLGSRNDVPAILSGCDALLLPSLIEGLPAVLLESMAAGCPVIAYNVGGISEVVKNGSTGFLVSPENEEEFAEKTIELIEDKAVATSMTAAAKHFIESGFENRLLSEKFVRVYNKFFLR